MKLDELQELVKSEPMRSVTRTVTERVPPSRKPILLTDYLALPGVTKKVTTDYQHVLGPPVSPATLEEWRTKHPSHSLPEDLVSLLERVDGIHLWANKKTGRAYQGLAPLSEWTLASTKLPGRGRESDVPVDPLVVISYHADWGAFVVLDVDSGTYSLMDAAATNSLVPIASNVGELLDWFWAQRIFPA